MLAISKDLVPFTTPTRKVREREVGGKGWNLFRLRRFGFPVPPWLVISSRVFDRVVRDQKETIDNILCATEFSDHNAVESTSLRIREIIYEAELPEQFLQGLMALIEKMFGKESLLSVRSSAVGEDSAAHSFAGQMDSLLNVRPAGVKEAIWKVWASAFSARTLVYRNHKRIGFADLSAAVIIQKMVQSASSGVIFTRDPESQKRECVISAGFGLGEGVVQDIVETDTYRIGWQSEEISKEVHTKEDRIILDATAPAGNRRQPVPAEVRSQQALTDTQIRQLRNLAIKAEESFGTPQDIEWAFDAAGKLFFLQSRPIVWAHQSEASNPLRVWDNSNIVESYPGLTLPLTFSFIRTGYEHTFRKAALGLALFRSEIEEKRAIFKNMIGLLDGRVYYNLLNWYDMLSYLPGFKRYKESWDRMIGISHKVRFPQKKRPRFYRFCTLFLVLFRLLTVRRTANRFFAHFDAVYGDFKDIDTSSATEERLIAVYEDLQEKLLDRWHLTIYNDFCAFRYFDWLRQLCTRWGLERYPNLQNDLLCREQGVESVAPVRSLVRLAELFHSERLYQELIGEESNHLIWQEIQHEPAYAALKEALKSHLKAFGDRGLEELKLERPTFREEPERLISLIRNYYHNGLSLEAMERGEERIRRDAEAFVRRSLKNPFKRLLFRSVLKNARTAIASRENMRFARTRVYGIVRTLIRRMADLFVHKGLLESSSDIYYLTMEEVFGMATGTAVTQNLQALVELRKDEYERFAGRTPKDRIETTGIPYLNPICGSDKGDGEGKRLLGVGCSPGIAEGKARVVSDPHSTNGNRDYILVAKSTDPGWVFLMICSKGIVVEKGSLLSHTAIIGRELGIPTIVSVKDATKRIPDGATVSINGSTGEIQWQ